MNKLAVQLPITASLVVMATMFTVTEGVVANATEKNGYDFPSAGVATDLAPGSFEIETVETKDAVVELNINEKFEAEEERMLSELVMANVSYTLNVRADATEESDKVGSLYKDCGGTILEQKDGWTKIQSGALTGWCSDEFLLFGDEAVSLAQDVGQWMITINSEAVRVRKEPTDDAEIMTVMSKTDIADFVELVDDEWISVEFDSEIGYVNSKYVNVTFHIDEGETIEQIRTRAKIEEQLRKEAEEAAAKEKAKAIEESVKKDLTTNRGSVTADADELRLLGALIYCEAGNQSYEGMVAVGAVVMNRVKSPAYPNTIYSVIYASGQFTPAMSGKVARIYNSGPPELCLQAAIAAINGETTVGGATHFRRNNGRAGYVLGDHVFW